MQSLIELARRTPLKPVASAAVKRLGYQPDQRMVLVVFADSDTVYGYPNLTDEEITGLIQVLQADESLGHYVSTVIKPRHDHERIQF
jgi:hypothetical protein